jgi:hypothetical protein
MEIVRADNVLEIRLTHFVQYLFSVYFPRWPS